MEHNESRRTAFDRRAALEQLERFGRDIERYRAQRKALGEEFESFVRSFEPAATEPAAGTSVARVATSLPAPEASVGKAAVPAEAVVHAMPAPASTRADALVDAPSFTSPAPAEPPTTFVNAPPAAVDAPAETTYDSAATSAPARGRRALFTSVGYGAGVIAVLAVALVVTRLWNRTPESAAPASTTPDPAPAVTAASSPASATPSAPASAPASIPAPQSTPAAASPSAPALAPGESELITIRRVWMRVIVDGERVLEREVPADTRVPLKAEKTIVIRTGDAGAVQLSLRGGKPAALGVEGEVVTRSFTVPPRGAPDGR